MQILLLFAGDFGQHISVLLHQLWLAQLRSGFSRIRHDDGSEKTVMSARTEELEQLLDTSKPLRKHDNRVKHQVIPFASGFLLCLFFGLVFAFLFSPGHRADSRPASERFPAYKDVPFHGVTSSSYAVSKEKRQSSGLAQLVLSLFSLQLLQHNQSSITLILSSLIRKV